MEQAGCLGSLRNGEKTMFTQILLPAEEHVHMLKCVHNYACLRADCRGEERVPAGVCRAEAW